MHMRYIAVLNMLLISFTGASSASLVQPKTGEGASSDAQHVQHMCLAGVMGLGVMERKQKLGIVDEREFYKGIPTGLKIPWMLEFSRLRKNKTLRNHLQKTAMQSFKNPLDRSVIYLQGRARRNTALIYKAPHVYIMNNKLAAEQRLMSALSYGDEKHAALYHQLVEVYMQLNDRWGIHILSQNSQENIQHAQHTIFYLIHQAFIKQQAMS